MVPIIQSRRWCFTVNNYVESDCSLFKELTSTYCVFGKEMGESGTPHLQGYVMFPTPKTLVAVKKIHGTCHWEVAKGTTEENRVYCTKELNYLETGQIPKTRKQIGEDEQQRWRDIRLAAEEGRFEDIPEKVRFNQKHLIESHHNDAMKRRVLEDTEVQHEWYYGATRTGKSRKARTENPTAYLKMCNKWWCGYEDEDVVIIEDFDKRHDVLAHHIKIWCDRYPFLAENKGGVKKVRPKKIIVTSNYPPEEIWTNSSDLDPILARFNVVCFNNYPVFKNSKRSFADHFSTQESILDQIPQDDLQPTL